MHGILNLVTGNSSSLLGSTGNWTVQSGDATISASREQSNHPTNGSLKIYANSADSILVTSGDYEIPARYTAWPIRGFAWVYSPSLISVTINVTVTTVDGPAITTNTVMVPALQWTLVSIEQESATTTENQVATASLSFQIDNLGVDTAAFICGPVLSTPLAVTFNQFAAGIWTRLPNYIATADRVQANPDFPLLRFLDVISFDAQKVFDLWDQIRYIPPDVGELKLSSLAHPDAAPLEWLVWLAGLVGVDLFDPTTGFTSWDSIQAILDANYMSDGSNEPAASWEEWSGLDDNGNWIGSTGDTNADESVTWEEIETLAPGVVNLEDKLRWQVKSAVAGLRGGTNNALVAAAQEMLTGSKYVRVEPNADGDPFRIRVVTLTAETDDIANLQKALEAATPAGYEISCVTVASVDTPTINEDGYQPPSNQGSYTNSTPSPGSWNVGWGSYTPVAGEFAIAALSGRTSLGSEPANPSGWTKVSTTLAETGTEDLRLSIYTRRLTGGDSLTFTIPTDWSQASITVTAFDSVGVLDVLPSTNTGESSATHLPPSVTADTNGATVVTIAAAATNSLSQRLGFLVPRGFSTAGTIVGGGSTGSAVLIGYQNVDAGSVPSPTVRCYNITSGVNSTTLGWSAVTFALRPISTLAPSPVSSPTVSTVTDTSAFVTWTIEGSPSSFDVYLDGVLVDSVAADVTSYEFTGLNPLTEYTFGVIARNPSGASATVANVVGSTADVPADPVSNLNVTQIGPSSATLTWNYTGNPAGFNLYVDGTFSQFIDTDDFIAASSAWTVTGLSPYTQYDVEVRTVNYSNTEATGQTDGFTTQSNISVYSTVTETTLGSTLTIGWDPLLPVSSGQIAIVAVSGVPYGYQIPDTPTGWTLQHLYADAASSDSQYHLLVYKRVIESTSDSPFSLDFNYSWSNAFGRNIIGTCVVIDGGREVVGASTLAEHSGDGHLTMPEAYAWSDNSLALAITGWAKAVPYATVALSTANGFTEVASVSNSSGGNYEAGLSIAAKPVAAGTVTGPTWEMTASSTVATPDVWAGITLAVNPYGGLSPSGTPATTTLTATPTARTAHIYWGGVTGPASNVEIFTGETLNPNDWTSHGTFGSGIAETWITNLAGSTDYYFFAQVDGDVVATVQETTLATPAAANLLFLDASDYTTVQLTDNKVSQWTDTSGNGNHFVQAAAVNRPTLARDNGGALVVKFDGTNDFLANSGDSSMFNIGPDDDLTVQIRCYTEGYGTLTIRPFLSKSTTAGPTATGWSLWADYWRMNATFSELNSYFNSPASSKLYGPNYVPMHLAFRVSATEISTFLNGKLEQTEKRDVRATFSNSLDLIIGKYTGGTTYFKGGIYQIVIDSYAVSDAQIAANAASWDALVTGPALNTFTSNIAETVTVAATYNGAAVNTNLVASWSTYSRVADDIVIMVLSAIAGNSDEPSTPSGWTKVATRYDNSLRTSVYAKKLTGSDATFSLTAPSSWLSAGGGGSAIKYLWVAYRNAADFSGSAVIDTGTNGSTTFTALSDYAGTENVTVDVVTAGTSFTYNGIELTTANNFTIDESYGIYNSVVSIAHRQNLPGIQPAGVYRIYDSQNPTTDRAGTPWNLFRLTLTPKVRTFTPLALRPAIWVDPTTASTVTQSGGYVSRIGYFTGNLNDPIFRNNVNASVQPSVSTTTLNSLPVLSFDGNDYMSDDALPHLYNGSKVLVAVVWNPGTVPATAYAGRTLLGVANPGYNSTEFSLGMTSTPTALTVRYLGETATVLEQSDASITANTAQVTTVLLDPLNSTASQRAKFWTGGATTAYAANTAIGQPEIDANGRDIYLGAKPGTTFGSISDYMDGYIAEMIVLIGPMATETNRILLRDYLTAKWLFA